MTGGHDQPAVLPAVRKDRLWVTEPAALGIVVYGRTLRELEASAHQALTLALDADPAPPVQLDLRSAELDALAAARLRYVTALREAVRTFRDDGVSWGDVARACQVKIADARAVMEGEPAAADALAPGDAVPAVPATAPGTG